MSGPESSRDGHGHGHGHGHGPRATCTFRFQGKALAAAPSRAPKRGAASQGRPSEAGLFESVTRAWRPVSHDVPAPERNPRQTNAWPSCAGASGGAAAPRAQRGRLQDGTSTCARGSERRHRGAVPRPRKRHHVAPRWQRARATLRQAQGERTKEMSTMSTSTSRKKPGASHGAWDTGHGHGKAGFGSGSFTGSERRAIRHPISSAEARGRFAGAAERSGPHFRVSRAARRCHGPCQRQSATRQERPRHSSPALAGADVRRSTDAPHRHQGCTGSREPRSEAAIAKRSRARGSDTT